MQTNNSKIIIYKGSNQSIERKSKHFLENLLMEKEIALYKNNAFT